MLGVVQDALAPKVIEDAGDAVAQAVGRYAECMSAFLNPRVCGVEPFVLHLHPSPGLESERLPGRQRDLAQHLKTKVLVAFLPVASAGALATRDLPDLRDQRARKGLVVFQQIVEPGDQIADGTWTLPDTLRHQRPQPEAARVILHPAGLERRVLTVVAEHEQAPALGMMHHVLGEHVHVRDGDRPYGPGRLAIPSSQSPARGPARQTARQCAGIRALAALSNRMQLDGGAHRPAVPAPRNGGGMRSPAVAAEVQRRRSRMWSAFSVIVARADEAIEQHHALAAVRLLQ